MPVNSKKNIRLKNNTKYFNADTSKVYNTFSSPETYQSRQIKIEGYETRLYWQFRYCDEHNGQTFFYTLTYNDNALPNHYGQNCFDYEDLRYLLTGGFYQRLRREYGTKFKYFVGAELGDGKGERGMHNNPHYHILFFLEPDNNPLVPYKKISSEDFRHLVRMYWQGFDEDEKYDGYRDYNEAKFGIAKEGENNGLVTDFRACMYCAKYVCKDVKLKNNEDRVIRFLKMKLSKDYRYSDEFTNEFFHTVIYDLFNTPLNPSKTEWCFNDLQLILELEPDAFDFLPQLPDYVTEQDITIHTLAIVRKHHLWKKYYRAYNEFIAGKVQEKLNEYRNRFCNKCRISHGVGDYALSHIEDKLNPSIQVPSKKGFKNRPIGMYYYRKLYTNVFIDKKGSPIRYLNDLGREYKVSRLPKQIDKLSEKMFEYFNIIIGNKKLYNRMLQSDINTSVYPTFSEFFRNTNYLLKENNILNIVKRYAEYKLVYEDRFFSYYPDRVNNDSDFPVINVIDDYNRFILPTCFIVNRSDYRLDAFFENGCKGYLPYSQHPYFLRFLSLFRVFDLCTDYFLIQMDNKKQKDAEEIAETKRFHNREKLKEFYSFFKN